MAFIYITNNMKRQVIRLTENDLKGIIKETVKKVLKEYNDEFIDPRKKQDEIDASWDAWENTFNNVNINGEYDKLPILTKLDKGYSLYDLYKNDYDSLMKNKNDSYNNYRHYHNFANDNSIKGFYAMNAMNDKKDDLYRDKSFWNGIKK